MPTLISTLLPDVAPHPTDRALGALWTAIDNLIAAVELIPNADTARNLYLGAAREALAMVDGIALQRAANLFPDHPKE
jgi:hypothetical protein